MDNKPDGTNITELEIHKGQMREMMERLQGGLLSQEARQKVDPFAQLRGQDDLLDEKRFCSWHKKFVRDHPELFPWPCETICVLEHYRQGTIKEADIMFFEGMTIALALKTILQAGGQWSLQMFRPKVMARYLGRSIIHANANYHQLPPSCAYCPNSPDRPRDLVNIKQMVFDVVMTACAPHGLDEEAHSRALMDFLENTGSRTNQEMILDGLQWIAFQELRTLRIRHEGADSPDLKHAQALSQQIKNINLIFQQKNRLKS